MNSRNGLDLQELGWTIELVTSFGELHPLLFHRFWHLEEEAAKHAIKYYADCSLDGYLTDGQLGIGYGGGPWDEHANGDIPRKGKNCCLTLVADALGLWSQPGWERLIEYLHFVDTGRPWKEEAKPHERVHPFGVNDVRKMWQRWLRINAGNRELNVDSPEIVELDDRCEDLLNLFIWGDEETREWDTTHRVNCAVVGPDGDQIIIESDHGYPDVPELVLMLAIRKYGDEEFVEKYQGRINLDSGDASFSEILGDLGVTHANMPEWGQMLRYVRWIITGRPGHDDHRKGEEYDHLFDLQRLVFLTWQRLLAEDGCVSDANLKKYVDRYIADLEVLLWAQEMLYAARDDIRERGVVYEKLKDTDDQEVNVVFVQTDNFQAAKAARLFHQAGLFVQRSLSGHWHIFMSSKYKGEWVMSDLMRLVALKEMDLRGGGFDFDESALRQEGDDPCGVWYYFSPEDTWWIKQIHNGTENHKRMPSEIGAKPMEDLVLEALGQPHFEPSSMSAADALDWMATIGMIKEDAPVAAASDNEMTPLSEALELIR